MYFFLLQIKLSKKKKRFSPIENIVAIDVFFIGRSFFLSLLKRKRRQISTSMTVIHSVIEINIRIF